MNEIGAMKRQPNANRKLALKLAAVAAGMFGFGFAMWPIYNVICDLTGLGGRGVKVAQEEYPRGSDQGVSNREVKLRFDATVNSALPWVFQAQDSTAMVRLGEMSSATYLAMNTSAGPVVGRAIYTVTPPQASLYFVKTECFCFTEQYLSAGETREMPVYYYIQPDLPGHIRELTLSYTFYRDEKATDLAMGKPTFDAED